MSNVEEKHTTATNDNSINNNDSLICDNINDNSDSPICNTPMLATQKFMINAGATALDFNEPRGELFSKGIKTSYDDDRMIFTAMSQQRKTTPNIYVQECNGLILDKHTWAPLMVPPHTLRINIDTNASDKLVRKGLYHIYYVEDGTCFNMYRYNNSWRIATTHGIDMNDIKWSGATYQQLIEDCLTQYDLTWESFTEQLDVNYCYSFGFKHPQFHKFQPKDQEITYKLWFIQSVNLCRDSNSYLWAGDASPIEKIGGQVFYGHPIHSIKDLYKKATNALETYLKTGEVCFGFILRAVNMSECRNHSDLLIESSLLRMIRNILYDNNLIDMCHRESWDKTIATALNAYLTPKLYEHFIPLFPAYADIFTLCSKVIYEIVYAMCELKPNEMAEPCKKTDIAQYLLNKFTKEVPYSFKNDTLDAKKKILMEYVVAPQSLRYIMMLFED